MLSRAGVFSPALDEGQLAHLWEGQRFPVAALRTRRGQPLQVVYRGRRGGGPGPDFRDAVVAGPWGLWRGDVELHVRASDFRRHGHGRDPAYDGLALHVVFWDDEGEDTLLASGRRVPVVALAPWVARRAQEIRRWLRAPPRWREPCQGAGERLGAERIGFLLDRLGEERLWEKAAALGQALEGDSADEVLWQGLLEALGYGSDRQGFRALAREVPWRRLAEGLRALPPQGRLEEARRMLLGADAGSVLQGVRYGRPGNVAGRRLEGAAYLADRYCQTGLARGLMAALAATQERGPSALVAALAVWDGSPALIGQGRALEMVTNVVLPYAMAAGGAALARWAQEMYGRLPRPARYGAVRHLDRALAEVVRVDARRQQGMLHLLRHYCSQGGCGRCPLS